MGAMWDGERVKQEGVEMGHGLGGVSCSPPIRAVPAELGVVAQGAVIWGGSGELRPLECRGLLAAEHGRGVSG